MTPARLGVLAVAGLAWSPSARATEITFCVRVDPDDFNDSGWGDRWVAGSGSQPLYGAHIRVRMYTAGGTDMGLYVFDDYVSGSTGCTTLDLSPFYGYRVTVYSESRVNGVDVAAYDGPNPSDGLHAWVGSNQFTPDGQTHNIVPVMNEFLAALSVGSFIMSRNNFGIQSEGLQYDVSGNYPYQNGSNQPQIRVYMEKRFIVSHETMHGIGRRRDENSDPAYEFDAPVGNCTAWEDSYADAEEIFSREYASAALKEGFANFFAAWTFNLSTESDCELPVLGTEGDDFDLDRDSISGQPRDVDLQGGMTYSCADKPVGNLQSWIDDRNWLQDLHAHTDCDGTLVGRGSVYDATRYFWDMHTDEGVNIGVLMDLYDDMNPKNWASRVNETFNLDKNPFCRLATAAAANSLTAAHNRQKDNGVDNGPCP